MKFSTQWLWVYEYNVLDYYYHARTYLFFPWNVFSFNILPIFSNLPIHTSAIKTCTILDHDTYTIILNCQTIALVHSTMLPILMGISRSNQIQSILTQNFCLNFPRQLLNKTVLDSAAVSYMIVNNFNFAQLW